MWFYDAVVDGATSHIERLGLAAPRAVLHNTFPTSASNIIRPNSNICNKIFHSIIVKRLHYQQQRRTTYSRTYNHININQQFYHLLWIQQKKPCDARLYQTRFGGEFQGFGRDIAVFLFVPFGNREESPSQFVRRVRGEKRLIGCHTLVLNASIHF